MPGPATQLFQVFFFRGISLLALSQCVSSKDKKETPPVNKKKRDSIQKVCTKGGIENVSSKFFLYSTKRDVTIVLET